jgi:hypothetical protein
MTYTASALLAWLLTAPPAPAADTCTVRGTARNWGSLEVTPEGGTSFGIVLAKANVAVALLPGADALARVAVDGPLVFEASAPRASVPLRARRKLRVLDGVATLTPRTRLVPTDVAGERVSARLDHDVSLTFEPIALPCAALTLGDAEALRSEVVTPRKARRLVPADTELSLAPTPEGAPVARLGIGAGSPLMLERLGARGAMVRVAAAWRDGTRLVGWTPSSAVEPLARPLETQVAGPGGGGCGSNRGGSYVGPALLHAGARVHDAPRGRAWATAKRAVRVHVAINDGWGALGDIPGLASPRGCLLEHAFVPAEDLAYPP